MIKKSWIILSVLSLFVLVNAVDAKTTTVTTDLAYGLTDNVVADDEDAWLARDTRIKKSGGELGLAYLNADKDAVEVHVYSNKTDQWNSATITTELIYGATEVKIYDIDIVALRTNWLVSFKAKHYDADGNLMQVVYESNNIGRGGVLGADLRNSVTTGDLSLDAPKKTEAYFEVFPNSQKSSNSYWVAWREDDELHIRDWVIDTSSEYPLVSLDDNDLNIDEDFFVLPKITKNGFIDADSGIYVVGLNGQNINVIKSEQGSMETVGELLITEDTELLDARWGEVGELHILYKRGDYVYSAMVDVNSMIFGTAEKIAKGQGFREGRFVVKYNDYGKGQYIIAWHKGKNYSYYKMRKGNTGWQDKGTVNKKAVVQDIYAFENGNIQLLCQYSTQKWCKVEYNASTKKWGDREWIKKSYDDDRISMMLRSVESQNSSNIYTTMRDRETLVDNKTYLWDAGDSENAKSMDWPSGYNYINQAVEYRYNQEWFFTTLRGEDGLKVMLGKKKNLFN